MGSGTLDFSRIFEGGIVPFTHIFAFLATPSGFRVGHALAGLEFKKKRICFSLFLKTGLMCSLAHFGSIIRPLLIPQTSAIESSILYLIHVCSYIHFSPPFLHFILALSAYILIYLFILKKGIFTFPLSSMQMFAPRNDTFTFNHLYLVERK